MNPPSSDNVVTALEMKKLVLFIPIWNKQLFVYLGGTAEEVHTWLWDTFQLHVDVPATASGFITTDRHVQAMWVKDPTNVANIAHEALHFTLRLLAQRGLTPTPESEEAYTYTLSYVMHLIGRSMAAAGTPILWDPKSLTPGSAHASER